MLAGQDFVLWDAQKSKFGPGRASFGSLQKANAFIEAPVVKEYTELVEALTRMYGRIGMHEVCKRCFRGERRGEDDKEPQRNPGLGCCEPCGLQGHEGCLSKPLGCATWMCGYTSRHFKLAYEFVQSVCYRLVWPALRRDVGFFNDERPVKLPAETRRLLRVARWAIESWEA